MIWNPSKQPTMTTSYAETCLRHVHRFLWHHTTDVPRVPSFRRYCIFVDAEKKKEKEKAACFFSLPLHLSATLFPDKWITFCRVWPLLLPLTPLSFFRQHNIALPTWPCTTSKKACIRLDQLGVAVTPRVLSQKKTPCEIKDKKTHRSMEAMHMLEDQMPAVQ